MARSKRLVGWRIAILPALIVGVVYWAGSTGCTPVPDVDGSADDNAADVGSNGNQSEDNDTKTKTKTRTRTRTRTRTKTPMRIAATQAVWF